MEYAFTHQQILVLSRLSMKKNFWLPLGAIAALLAGFYWLSDHEDDREIPYMEKIEEHRREVEYFMRNSEGSPFADSLVRFTRLNYYPIDPNYRIRANFKPANSLVSVELSTSDGRVRTYITYGYLNFRINNTDQRLTVYQPVGTSDRELFLGFGDATSANETYGAGRYINVEPSDDTEWIIDFNLAYNPYCAYNEDFICPFPPRENILSIPIYAGEKNYID